MHWASGSDEGDEETALKPQETGNASRDGADVGSGRGRPGRRRPGRETERMLESGMLHEGWFRCTVCSEMTTAHGVLGGENGLFILERHLHFLSLKGQT